MRSLILILSLLVASLALAGPQRYTWKTHAEEPPASEVHRQRAREVRHQSIQMLEELVVVTEPGPRRAEMLLRLADLYFQESRDLRLQEYEDCDARWVACDATDSCGAWEPTQCDHTGSEGWSRKSVGLYRQILQAEPRWDKADDARWYLASALLELERPDEALEVFTELVKVNPDSLWTTSAWLQIGEYHFEHEDAYKAHLAYRKATADPGEDVYGYALYKLAWCSLNLGEYDRAIDEMKRVVLWSTPAEGEEGPASSLALNEEALRDLVRFFAEAGESEEMVRFFEKLGREDLLRNSLERLAETYAEQGQAEEAILTWKGLIARDPMSRDNPDHQHRIASLYREMGRKDEALREVRRLESQYGPGSSWHRHNQVRPEVLDQASAYLEKDLRQLAVSSQQRCKKLGARGAEDCTVAEAAWESWLDSFSDGPRAYEARYAYGELLYGMKRFEDAWTQYDAVVHMDPGGSHSRFCAESAIFAADEVVKAQGAVPRGEVSEWQGKLVASCDLYADHWPEEEKARTALYKAAWVLYHQEQMAPAAERFRRVIAMDPSSREAEQAAHLILDSFVVEEDWGELVLNARFFYEQEGLGSPVFKEEVHAILEKATFQEAQARQEGVTRAEGLVAFVSDFPDSELAGQALNNAEVFFFEAGELDRAEAARRVLVEDERFGPDSPYFFDAAAAVGFAHESRGQFAEAAHLYEAVFAAWPQHREGLEEEALEVVDTRARDALWSAAWFRRSLDEPETAVSHYSAYVEAWPEDERAGEGLVAVISILEEQEQWEEAAQACVAVLDRADEPLEWRMHAHLRRGYDLESADQTEAALDAWREGVTEYEAEEREPGPATIFYAQAHLELLGPQVEAFMAMDLEGAPGKPRSVQDRVGRTSLKAKGDALEALEAEHMGIYALDVAEAGLAALVSQGRAHEEMARAFRQAPIPDYLTPEQADLYRLRLEDMAWMQDEKAAGYYAIAVEGAREADLHSEAEAVFGLERLRELRPEEYPHLFEELPVEEPIPTEEPMPPFETEL